MPQSVQTHQSRLERSDAKTSFLTSAGFTLPTAFARFMEAVGTIVSPVSSRNAAEFGPNARNKFDAFALTTVITTNITTVFLRTFVKILNHMGVELIYEHFPQLTDQQREQFAKLDELYRHWNAQINVISRKDIDNLYVNHVLHSLAIVKLIKFVPGARVLDLGTGGGFPGIPLAIMFPETYFELVDSRNKKIIVCNEVIAALGLENCTARHGRVEETKGKKFDFIVTRAVAKMAKLTQWSLKLIAKNQQHALPNGILALKGRNLKEEMEELGGQDYVEEYPLHKWFPYDFFEEKALVYLQY